MSLPVMQQSDAMSQIESVLIAGDLARLSSIQRETYYLKVCETLGLNPLTKPFDYITLNGKLVLYANKGCAEQLRSIRKISINISAREMISDICVVTAIAKGSDGREDGSTGAVNVSGLKGEALANAMMKAETKAKRRVTLSICGLNMLDETEVESISDKEKRSVFPEQPTADEGFVDESYRIPFGKFAKRSLEEVGPDALASYVTYLESSAHKKGQVIQGQVKDFVDRATAYIVAFEQEVAAEAGARV